MRYLFGDVQEIVDYTGVKFRNEFRVGDVSFGSIFIEMNYEINWNY